MNDLIKSRGIAAKPIPPKTVNKNHDRKEIKPIAYIGKETSRIKSLLFVMQLLSLMVKTVATEEDCKFLILHSFVVTGMYAFEFQYLIIYFIYVNSNK